MKIVSWNVNSIKARADHVLRYLTEQSPNVLMVQELKGEILPEDTFKDAGYNIEYKGQKAYNGVAIFSKHAISKVSSALPGDDSDDQARYLEVDINNIRMINIYAPNGNPLGTEKFPYKLGWMDRLITRVKHLRQNKIPFIIGGDFNIIPAGIDCYDPKAWKDDALFQPESIAKYRALINLGLTDAFRVFDTRAEQYTFWDYQAGAWPKNNGIRIDHFLTCPELTDRLTGCEIHKEPRGWDKPSDHTPIAITLKTA
jgi:exodeoxyribonuclease-3